MWRNTILDLERKSSKVKEKRKVKVSKQKPGLAMVARNYYLVFAEVMGWGFNFYFSPLKLLLSQVMTGLNTGVGIGRRGGCGHLEAWHLPRKKINGCQF